jgi:hypothetical protein
VSKKLRTIAGLLGTGLLVVLTACGGSDAKGADAPADASQEEFCSIISDIDLSDPKSFVDDLSTVGTPASIPADARAGFEVMIDNATADEISDGDQEKVSAFVAYFTTTCAAG